jgi:beta-glucosidase
LTLNRLPVGPSPANFIWASGIEDTFVPQTRPGHRSLDEYELVGHYDHWREDLALGRELGIQALRWGVPWYRVEKLPGEFDWSWTDQVVRFLVEDLGITPIIDLMHYGCPYWLRREFASESYPEAVASYAGAFARRYKGLVRWYTPLNEPLINSLMCGRRGQWPPYLRGDRGYIRIMLQIVKGIFRTVKVLKEVDPEAVMVHVEATGLSRATRVELKPLAIEDQRRGFLSYDLLTGKVTPDHPLYTWLLRNGAGLEELASIAGQAIPIEVMGMNFYPQWSTKQVSVSGQDRLSYRNVERDGAGFATLIKEYYDRYGVPIMVTETSARGRLPERARWLEASVTAIRQLRAQGVPVIGYTWFPLFTMYDWRYRTGSKPLESYRIELGLYKLRSGDQGPRWEPTPLVEQFQSYIRNPESAVGPLAGSQV